MPGPSNAHVTSRLKAPCAGIINLRAPVRVALRAAAAKSSSDEDLAIWEQSRAMAGARYLHVSGFGHGTGSGSCSIVSRTETKEREGNQWEQEEYKRFSSKLQSHVDLLLVRLLQSKTHQTGVELGHLSSSTRLERFESPAFGDMLPRRTVAHHRAADYGEEPYAAEEEIEPDSISRRMVRSAAANSSRLT